jgi:hypothetical protein
LSRILPGARLCVLNAPYPWADRSEGQAMRNMIIAEVTAGAARRTLADHRVVDAG